MPQTVGQWAFAAGELSPGLYGRVDLTRYQSGLAECSNCIVRPHGGVANRAGSGFVGPTLGTADACRLIPFRFSTQQAYALEFTAGKMRVIKEGGYVLATTPATITSVTAADPAVVTTSAAHGLATGQHVFLKDLVGMTELSSRFFSITVLSSTTFSLQHPDGRDLDASSWSAGTGGNAYLVYELATPYVAAELAALTFAQSADVIYLAHRNHAPRELARLADNNWTLTALTFAPVQAAPTGVGVSKSGTGTGTTYKYVVTAINGETGEESLPSSEVSVDGDLTTSPNSNTVTWSAASGIGANGEYNCYREDNGLYAYIGNTLALTFTDQNIEPDRAITPPQNRNPFSGSGDYPGAVTLFEQRLVFASTDNNPQTIWFSSSANFANFSVSSPAQDSDAITATLVGQQVNAVKHLFPLDESLISLTAAAEWAIDGGDNAFVTPTSVKRRAESFWGSADVRPLAVGTQILFLQDKSARVRDLGYEWSADGYQSTDLSIFAEHLFEGHTIVDWCYAQAPDMMVWLVRDDGILLGLTYLREHQIWGWGSHTLQNPADGTNAVVESVCAVPEGDMDAVYAVVKYTMADSGGNYTARYVVRLKDRRPTAIEDSWFLDCALQYSGAATTSIPGLWHLEGQSVNLLADGDVLPAQIVANGTVTLPNAASKVLIGIGYTSRMQTLPLDLSPNVAGKSRAIKNMAFRIRDTRGIKVGPSTALLVEWKQRATGDLSTTIPLETGDFDIRPHQDWSKTGQMVVQQTDPLPMTILAIMPTVTYGN